MARTHPEFLRQSIAHGVSEAEGEDRSPTVPVLKLKALSNVQARMNSYQTLYYFLSILKLALLEIPSL